MEEMDFRQICRICLKTGSMMSLFKVGMYKKMMAIASVQVWPNDGLPGQICLKCASKLHIAYQLRKLCEKSDVALRQYQIYNSQEDQKDIVLNDLTKDATLPQVEIEAHRVFDQGNTSVIDVVSQNQSNYNTFEAVPHPNQVTYTNSQIMPAYNIPAGQMIYNSQYPIGSHIQSNASVPPVEMLQLEINNSLQASTKSANDTENLSKTVDNKAVQDGKSCKTCGKVFRTNIKLNRHMKIHNRLPGDFPHKCPVCGKGFSHGGNYKIHLRIHNNERPFKCPQCGKGCRQSQDLEKHMRTHTGERPHKCHFCTKAFATSSNLAAHIRTHTGERPYVCCVCQKAFCQSNELTKHMRTHTGEKSHICDVCHKGFNGSSGLLAHRRQHTGERPYVCPQCNKDFTSSNCLSAHIKTHNNPFPLKCGQCEQSFRNLSNLKDHMSKEHIVGGLIQCKLCDQAFERVNEYLLHIRKHKTAADS